MVLLNVSLCVSMALLVFSISMPIKLSCAVLLVIVMWSLWPMYIAASSGVFFASLLLSVPLNERTGKRPYT